jgi:hypothetical protein
LLRDKSLIDQFRDFGITCTYDEVLRFKTSDDSAVSKKSELRGILSSDDGLIQAVADNFDGNISSPNGLRFTHALALLITQVQSKISSINV